VRTVVSVRVCSPLRVGRNRRRSIISEVCLQK
jgi:hypothetical protein